MMEGTSILPSPSSYSSKTHFNFKMHSSPISSPRKFGFVSVFPKLLLPQRTYFTCANKNRTCMSSSYTRRAALSTSTFKVDEALDKTAADSVSSLEDKDTMPKIDRSGRFCSPRAARELALSIVYAACLEGSDPVRLFEKRVNARREPGYEFDKSSLLKYNHMSFGGPPVTTETVEEADELLQSDDIESAIEAEVLSAPPKLVYSKLILRLTRKFLVAISDEWDTHVLGINKIAPANWKNEPAGRILELCILHLAMSEISVLGTRHQIVINEAVDLAKRFCDGAAPRIVNGCLRTFVKDLEAEGRGVVQDALESNRVAI